MNTPDEQDRAMLAPLRDAEPSSNAKVNVEDAIRSGRRIRRQRAGLGAAAAAAITALVVLVVPTLIPQQGDQLQVSAAPAEFDPLVQVAGVGSAGGFTPYRYQTGQYAQRAELKLAGAPDPEQPVATVTIYPRGQLPAVYHGLTEPPGDSAPPVFDRPGRWVSTPSEGPGRVEYAWQWAEGAWAFASVPANDPEARAKANRVAQSVDFSNTNQVRVPFTLPMPPGQRLTGVLTDYGNAESRPVAGVIVSTAGANDPGAVEIGARSCVGITPNATAANRPAEVTANRVVLIDAGSSLCSYAAARVPNTVDIPTLTELASSVRQEGNPGNPATWPVNPIR